VVVAKHDTPLEGTDENLSRASNYIELKYLKHEAAKIHTFSLFILLISNGLFDHRILIKI